MKIYSSPKEANLKMQRNNNQMQYPVQPQASPLARPRDLRMRTTYATPASRQQPVQGFRTAGQTIMDGSPMPTVSSNPVGTTTSNQYQTRQPTSSPRDTADRTRSKGRLTNNPYDADQDHFADAGMSTKSLSSIGGSGSSSSRSPSQ